MTISFDRRIRAILENSGKLDPAQIEDLVKRSETERAPVAQVVTEKGFLTEHEYLYLVSKEANLPPVDVECLQLDPDVLSIIEASMAETHGVIPVARIGRFLTIALANPFDVPLLDHLKVKTGCELRPVIASYTGIKRAIQAGYRQGDNQMEELLGGDDADVELRSHVDLDGEIDPEGSDDSKVVRAINMILYQSVTEKVSDIHIEPFDRITKVRFRKDGLLTEAHSLARSVHSALISRIKILASLDIAEKRRPQDGKFQIKVNGRQVDLRVSILPMIHGEKAVLRLLDSSNLVLRLEDLGFEPECLTCLKEGLAMPYGMILVTGPTGSGKSTTLYSAVNERLSPESNFVTVEDPVEYQLQGVNQVPVNAKRGLTFAGALRSILRQDPDVIMVGEIRDQETLDIAIKAALTGHLVLSTLHTNDAPSALTRMVQMGVDPFLVASSVIAVAAQRLARKLCTNCRRKTEVPADRLLEVGMTRQEADGATIYSAQGCTRCVQGYRGRFALLEVLENLENIKEMILGGANEIEIKRASIKNGMITLRRAGIRNVLRGTTSIEEVLRVTASDSREKKN